MFICRLAYICVSVVYCIYVYSFAHAYVYLYVNISLYFAILKPSFFSNTFNVLVFIL